MASGDQKDWSRSRHELRGSGSASRIRLNTGLLEESKLGGKSCLANLEIKNT